MDYRARAALVEEPERRVEMSRAAYPSPEFTSSIPHPPNLQYYPFQLAGIEYITEALSRQKGVLVADEMGLGKTIEAIGYINLTGPGRVLVVCPAFLKLNWLREMERWLVERYEITMLDGRSSLPDPLPSRLAVIVNYDILGKHLPRLVPITWDLLILDESHYIKDINAKRTRAVLGRRGPGLAASARRVIAMTGTPTPNHPGELLPQLLAIGFPIRAKEFFSRYVEFEVGSRYDPETGDEVMWHRVVGGKNLEELQYMLRAGWMLRREKRDVLPQLPAKVRQAILMSPEGLSADLRFAHTKFMNRIRMLNLDGLGPEEAASILRSSLGVDEIGEIEAIRLETALAKLPEALEFIDSAVEGSASGKVVVFAHHREVLDRMADHYGPSAVVVHGGTPLPERSVATERFQHDPSVRVFLGSIRAIGLGITLTASSTVVFVELDWSPAAMEQAEDRVHRIGQLEQVNVYYLVVDDTIDAYIANTIIHKEVDIARLLKYNHSSHR
ncbi:MAG: DEAD/DEAH box helicase [Anaerolineae bacterium]